jgi:hypothetical protein
MSDIYHSDQRSLQDRFDTHRLADRLDEDLVHAEFSEGDRAFIERLDMFFIATVDSRGRANCSYKGGAPGFVRVVDPQTLAFPNYNGNGMYLTMGNIAQTHEAGLLFIDFERQSRMRVNGTATLHEDDPLRGAIHRAGPGTVNFPELPPLYPQAQAGRAFPFCTQKGRHDPRTGMEKGRLGGRRPARGRSGA